MLPKDFIQRLKTIVPIEHFESIINTFDHDKATCFRVNILKANAKTIITELKDADIPFEPVAWYPDAFIIPVEKKSELTKTRAYLNGEIYIQNLSSMLPVIILDPKPGEEILDLTAAPGSKTTQIAAHMQNQGRIAAVEKSRKRFFKLKQNLKSQGITCAEVYNKDGRLIFKSCPERFDRVLLDAPCSSEARFNINNSESYKYWNLKKIKEMARNQWVLLNSAMLSLKSGGVLVYSTCSFAPEENEAIIARLLKKYGDAISIEPIKLHIENIQPGLTVWQDKKYPAEIANAVRVLPNEKMSGFFICKILKK